MLTTSDPRTTGVNPCHACPSLGAAYLVTGIPGGIPLIHGPQSCCGFIRYLLTRHFSELRGIKALADEDAEVFGGRRSIAKSVRNLVKRYDPSFIGIISTCLSGTTGDDIEGSVRQVKAEFSGETTEILLLKISNYSGSHTGGYDTASRAALQHLVKSPGKTNGRVNLIPGIINPGDIREVKRMMNAMGVPFTVLFDLPPALIAPPETGTAPLSHGRTPLADLADALNASGTVALCGHAGGAAAAYLYREFRVPGLYGPLPVGIESTDRFLENVLKLSRADKPAALNNERSRLERAVADAIAYTTGKKVALTADSDLLLSMTRFVCELKMEPTVVMSSSPSAVFTLKINEMAAEFGVSPVVIAGSDLTRFEATVKDTGADVVFGPSYTAGIANEAGLSLVRIGFPIYDQPSCHRWPILGYKGGLRLLDLIVGAVSVNYQNTCTGPGAR